MQEDRFTKNERKINMNRGQGVVQNKEASNACYGVLGEEVE